MDLDALTANATLAKKYLKDTEEIMNSLNYDFTPDILNILKNRRRCKTFLKDYKVIMVN